jgi:hypothetical protein
VREQVGVDDHAYFVRCRGEVGAAVAEACVGVEHVHRSEMRDRVVDQGGDHCRVAHVADERDSADPRRDPLGLLGVHVGDDDAGAVAGEAASCPASRRHHRALHRHLGRAQDRDPLTLAGADAVMWPAGAETLGREAGEAFLERQATSLAGGSNEIRRNMIRRAGAGHASRVGGQSRPSEAPTPRSLADSHWATIHDDRMPAAKVGEDIPECQGSKVKPVQRDTVEAT